MVKHFKSPNSSMIDEARYNPVESKLYILFHNGVVSDLRQLVEADRRLAELFGRSSG